MQNQEQSKVVDFEVVVIGGGIAGLAAARCLSEAGKSVVLLEASGRMGGRMRSEQVPGLSEPVELGAEFVHGQPPDLLQLLKEAGLDTYELHGRQYSWDGEQVKPEEEDASENVLEHLDDYPLQNPSQDASFADYLAGLHLPEEAAQQTIGYVEGFNAADASRISTQALAIQQRAEDEIQGDRLFHVRQGYSALTDYVRLQYGKAGGSLRLRHEVTGIQWGRKNVCTTASIGGEKTVSFNSRCVLVTVPLCVLQAGRPAIEPRPDTLNEIERMAMGPVHRISLVFKHRFWAEPPYHAEELNFLFAREATPAVWWSAHPSESPVLTGWIGGRRVTETPAADLLETTLGSLARIFNLSRHALNALLVSSHTHDWNSDPLSCGAYSYVCTGGVDASLNLSKPIDDTLFFAGEHTDVTGHWGTVHGALRSGIRAAEQILASLEN